MPIKSQRGIRVVVRRQAGWLFMASFLTILGAIWAAVFILGGAACAWTVIMDRRIGLPRPPQPPSLRAEGLENNLTLERGETPAPPIPSPGAAEEPVLLLQLEPGISSGRST